MSKHKTYKLNVQDLLQIPEESFDNFLIDLKKWHKTVRNTVSMLEAVAKATNTELPEQIITMNWIDDGKHEGHVYIKEACYRYEREC